MMNRKNLILGFFFAVLTVIFFHSSVFAVQGCGSWVSTGFFLIRDCSYTLNDCTRNFKCRRDFDSACNFCDCYEVSASGPGCLAITDTAENTIPGTVDTFTFQDGHAEGGEYIQPLCKFRCTGTGSSCPATEPLVFEQTSQEDEPLQCKHSNFTADAYGCITLAYQTCQQTTYHPEGDVSSGKVDMDGNQHSSPPTPTGTPSPGEIETYDFGMVTGNGLVYPYCIFTCTGIGSFCPTDPLFEEGSGPGQHLHCSNGNFQGGLEACQQLANQTCQQTTAYSNTGGSLGQIYFDDTWNAFTSIDRPMGQITPIIQVQSIIGPQGESLDSVQYFYNMAIQELKNKNAKVPVKK